MMPTEQSTPSALRTLTLCIPIRNPDPYSLEWLSTVVAEIAARKLPVEILVSIHSTSITPASLPLKRCRVLATETELTYDQNVTKLAEHVETEYLLLAGAGDRLDLRALDRLERFVVSHVPRLDVIVLTPELPKEGFACIRFGFIGTFVFRAQFIRQIVQRNGNYGGWMHTGVFLEAVRLFRNVGYFNEEIVTESLPKGFRKDWVSHGKFINYQVALARLAERIIPRHPLCAVMKAQALGNWPFDLLRTLRYRRNFTQRTRRYASVWLKRSIRERGTLTIVVITLRQLASALARRYV